MVIRRIGRKAACKSGGTSSDKDSGGMPSDSLGTHGTPPRGAPSNRSKPRTAGMLHEEDIMSHPASEEALQAVWADFLRVALPPDAVHHHSPNEGRRGWRAQRALKSSGCAAGWPDSEIVWEGRIYFLELKMPGNKPTKLQAERHEELRRAGAKVAVATSLSELVGTIIKWGIPLRIGLPEYARLRTAGRMTAAQYREMKAR